MSRHPIELVLLAVLALVAVSVIAVPAAAQTYYLALGDSLAAGVGASSGHGYVDDVFAFEQQGLPGLQLVNLSCSGATTDSVIHGVGCAYNTGTQLGDAEAFLAAHAGQVAFVTIDIGGNDVIPCFFSTPIDTACGAALLPAVVTNLTTILIGLRSAGGSVPIIGLTYYDPFLAYWLQGGAGMQAAHDSVKLSKSINRALKKTYKKSHAGVAAGDKAFLTSKFSLKGSWAGQTVPVNVAQACLWTRMCTANDIHPNDAGYAALAGAIEPVIAKLLPTP